jgi:RNA polymerase primary sigma factor
MTVVAEKQVKRPAQTHSPSRAEAIRARTIQLLRTEISFISSPDFGGGSDHQSDLEMVDGLLQDAAQSTAGPDDLPAHLHRMCETDLLTQEQEQALFREMNHLKFRANSIRSRLDPDQPDLHSVETIESMLSRAEAIRNHLIKANMRLVMAIAKKFVSPQHSFDDMLSDGTITLLQTVEKFDYSRGFRFSTYAYRSIVRNVYHTVTTQRGEQARYIRDAEQWAFEQEDDRSSSLTDRKWDNLRRLTATMVRRLDRREQFIIRSRYSLGVHRRVRTLQCLATKLGVSKERVRQLEQRAIGKLNAMAADLDLDDVPHRNHCR